MIIDVVNGIASWVGLMGFIPSVGVTLTYGLGKHGVWRKSALGRTLFTLFLGMTLVYVVFLTQKLFGHSNWWYPELSLVVFSLLTIGMWATWFIIIHEQAKGAATEKPARIIVKRVGRKR